MSDLSRSLVDAAAEAAERIATIAHSVRGEAVIADRPGQMARLEALADDLLALSAEVRSSPAAVLETLEADLVANMAACRNARCAQCERAAVAIADFRRLAAEVKTGEDGTR